MIGALSAIGKIIRQSEMAQDAALAVLLAAEISDAKALWRALRDEEQRRLIDRARPEGAARDVLELLGHPESAVGDDFWSIDRFKAMVALIPETAAPLLFGWIEPFDIELLDWCDAFVEIAPKIPLLLAGPPEGYAMLETAVSSGRRSTVLLWEGRIELPNKEPRHFKPVHATEGGESVRTLIEAEAPEAIPLLETALADPGARDPLPSGVYGSAAEAFLAKMLEIHPVTAGLFTPQGLPGFRMAGGPAATVDFLALDLRIAIEVDGPHHFDPVQYRRDRHKDLELQSRGYVILRFLAEDVARDFERIRKTIHRVVHMRCLSRSQSGINVLDESGDTR